MDDQDDVLVRIDNLKEVIRKTPPDLLKERVYICVANGCILLTAYKRMKGETGWSSKLHDEFSQPLLTSQQQAQIEAAFAAAPWILDILDHVETPEQPTQAGGLRLKMPSIKLPGSQLLEETPGLPKLTGNDISMDALFEKFLEKSEQMDQFWGKFAYESPGFAKKVNRDIPITKTFSIPAQPILNLIMLILDSIRLSYGLAGQKTQVLTTLILLEELLTGQWRQMLLTAVGFVTPSGMAAGVIFKYLVNAWTLVNPDLRTQIVKDAYKGTKSLFLGFLLWSVSNLSPSFIREKIDAAFATMRAKVENLDAKIKAVEDQTSAALASQGKQARIRGIDLEKFKTLSLHDIQNLQALATWDTLICTSEFQEMLAPLEASPIFRLILELLNIPTTSADKFEACGNPPYKSLSEEVESSFTPVIEDTPEASEKKAEELLVEPAPAPEESKETEPTANASESAEPASQPAKEPEPAPQPTAVPPKTPEPTPQPAATPPPPLTNVKKGGSVFKLKKKSTRYRKATPRRMTRRA